MKLFQSRLTLQILWFSFPEVPRGAVVSMAEALHVIRSKEINIF